MADLTHRQWLASLPQPEREALMSAATELRLASNQCVYRQGDEIRGACGAFFGVLSGMLKLSIVDGRGRETILAIVEPGCWFGEVAILNRSPRAQSAIALSNCTVLCVSAETFAALMERSAFAQGIARLLAGRLGAFNGIMSDSVLLGVRERLARRLLALAQGEPGRFPGPPGSIRISQGILAMLLGVSRVTLNKALRSLVEIDAIALHYGRIEIKDRHALIEAGEPPC